MIVVGGENLIDYIQISKEDDLPVYKAIPGGSCYNVAIAAARQGQKVSYITPISNDSLGNILASRLEADGVKVCAPRVQEPTSLAVVSLNDSQPSYQFYRTETAERKITCQMLNEINPASIKIFHIGSISLIDGEDADIWEQRFGELAEQGVVTSLDPNIRQLLIKNQSEYLSRLKRMIKYAHILKLSDEDLKYIYSEKSVDDAFDEICRGTDAKIVVLTMGEKGARVKTGEFSFKVNAVVCDHIVDTVGAGDTFMGTVLAEINDKNISVAAISGINESELKRIIERASEAAALNCQTAGCNPPYKNDF
jgi:fructokinase